MTTTLSSPKQALSAAKHQGAPRAGVLAALWVPMDGNGRVLRPALARHLAWLKKAGIHGVLALGSTGEFARMSLAQREETLATIVELAAPLPVLANLSSIRLDEVIALGRAAQRLGVAGATIMPPYFYPVSQADMLEFFLRAADGVDLPFYLYNFPELTSNRISIETAAEFAGRANLVGLKQSGAEFAYHRELIALGREKNFSVFSGADTRLPEAFALGAAGAIGGMVNIVPEFMVEIYRLCREGAAGDIALPAARMVEAGRILTQMQFPLNVACGVEARGFDPGAPKTVVSPESARLYRQIVSDFRMRFAEWGLKTP
ncbi:MAG: dihydrodipicolinate synthase family protein [Candidatus Didemnitutus sp.]|nr:dihydrodipicolinate synthase family protein [Candidatus Didemnitutus sp.]